jgi:hypothetical protein
MTNTPSQLAIQALRNQALLELQSAIQSHRDCYQKERQELILNRCLFALEQLHHAIIWVKTQCDYDFEPVISSVRNPDENLSCE